MGDPLNELADHGVQVGNPGRGSDSHAAALELAGAHLFDPSGKDRPMKDWVSVSPAHSARWLELAELALSAPR